MSCENFIVKSFEGQKIDFIEREKGIWITSGAIAKGLEIDRTNINQIYHNNKELLEPYTCVMKIITKGQRREVRVFDKVGFIGICMRSNSPKALPFQQWTLSIIEEIERKGYYITREIVNIIEDLVIEQKKQRILLDHLKKDLDLAKSHLKHPKETKCNSILKNLDSHSWISAKELLKIMDVSKSALYYYLNHLETQSLIEISTLKSNIHGRPTRKYRLSYIS